MADHPFDPETQSFLAAQARAAAPWDDAWPLSRQRTEWEAQCRKASARRPARLMVEDIVVEGLRLRIYRPPGEDAKPGVLHAHGGGWTMGSVDTHDDFCAELADRADVVVVSFDYRLAPEHPHPAQIEDAKAVLDWMRSSGRAVGLDPTHILVSGDSAGGQVVAGLALKLMAEGQPQLRGLVLIYPVLGGDIDTTSYLALAQSPTLQRVDMIAYLEALLGPRGSPGWSDPAALPNIATDVSGLPPCFISVAGHDPLKDDGAIFAAKLKAAGVAYVLREEPALAHSHLRSRHASAAAATSFKAITDAARHLAHEGLLPGE